jgi:hypothetical protein
MTDFLLFTLVSLALAILVWGTSRRERMIQYPFLSAAVFLGWMVPQLFGLNQDRYLPGSGLDKTILMAILCLSAIWLGYESNRRPASLFSWNFDRQRLLICAAVLSATGAVFYFLVGQLAAEATMETGGQWTGVITIYFFFSSFLSYGFAISLILFLRTPSRVSLSLVIFGLFFYLNRILIQGRRAELVELSLMLLFALWFNRRLLPNRVVMVSVLLLGTLVINSIGDYRSVMLDADRAAWSGADINDVLSIDFVGNLRSLISGEAGNEDLRNAVYNIEATDRIMAFDFGLSHWNSVIRAHVPTQIVGTYPLYILQFPLENHAFEVFDYLPYTGSTPTGLSDAFASFWYFGPIKFFLIGFILSRWYQAAVRGHFIAQLVLMLTISDSLHAITHSTHSFFNSFVPLGVFLLPFLWFARRQRAQPGRPSDLQPKRPLEASMVKKSIT